MLLLGILDEDRRTRKSENLQVVEKVDDIFVAVAEVAAVALRLSCSESLADACCSNLS